MSTKYKARDNDKAHFVAIITVNWVDLFTRLEQKKNTVESLEYYKQNNGITNINSIWV